MSEREERYSTVRDILSDFIGTTLLDITQHDYDDYKRDGIAFVMLHFSNNRAIYVQLSETEATQLAYDEPPELESDDPA